jgi:hypothetical protein
LRNFDVSGIWEAVGNDRGFEGYDGVVLLQGYLDFV